MSIPGLPDGRPRHRTGTVRGPRGYMERVYCVNCGRDGGYAVAEYTSFIFYLCPACEHLGRSLHLPQMPENIARGKGFQ